VVKSAIETLKGSIELHSKFGEGTTFRLMVPLTLASIQALLFRVRGRLYAVPLASVSEITRIIDKDIHRVDGHEVFQLRQQVLALVRLDRLLAENHEVESKRLFVIVIGTGGRKFGLAVDSLMGEEELVSGASILGDGTVVLILNVPAVVSYLSRIPALGATA
jgi:two-component system chemotaxis sensor kinase CheA